MSQATDMSSAIAALIESLSPKQIKAVMEGMKKPRRIIDRSRQKRMARNKLYFKNVPAPYACDTFEVYLNHSDGIREQILSEGG